MLTMALMSPVFTSMTMATPTFPFISRSFSTSALSDRSCIPTSIVVTMSEPFTGSFSTSAMFLLNTFLMLFTPGMPRSSRSNHCSSPFFGCPFQVTRSPIVLDASEPNGFFLVEKVS